MIEEGLKKLWQIFKILICLILGTIGVYILWGISNLIFLKEGGSLNSAGVQSPVGQALTSKYSLLFWEFLGITAMLIFLIRYYKKKSKSE